MTHDRSARGTGSEDGPDGELRGRLESLKVAVGRLGGGAESRREALVEGAEARGLARTTAEQAYDIAREVGLDPAYGLAVVAEGISVQLLPSPRPAVESTERSEPEWVDRPPGPDEAERERRLRQTFRRLRTEFEEQPDPDAAVDAFARNIDLEPYDF